MMERLRSRLARWFASPAFDDMSKRLARLERDLRKQPAPVDDVERRVEQIHGQLQSLVDDHEVLNRNIRHLKAGIDGLVRAAYVDVSALPYPERLTARRFRLHSQNQEDGILWALFQEAGITDARFVELGSGASGGNAAMLAAECGWTGLMVEGNPDSAAYAARKFPRVSAVCAWITPESVNDLLQQHGYTGSVDLLSIDIDGNDYWVLQALTAASPRVLVLEYNSMFGPDRAVTIPYDPKFNRREHRFCYFGASLTGLTRLAARKGYRLVAVEPSGVNAFYLRNDVAPSIPACEPARAFHMVEKYNALMREKEIDVFKWVTETGRQLVEVE